MLGSNALDASGGEKVEELVRDLPKGGNVPFSLAPPDQAAEAARGSRDVSIRSELARGEVVHRTGCFFDTGLLSAAAARDGHGRGGTASRCGFFLPPSPPAALFVF